MPVALVTGASRGIGRAISLKLAEDGYDLFLVARSRENLRDTAAQAEAMGRRVETFGVDLAGAEAPGEVAGAFCEAFPCLDLLVNNAGIALARDYGEYTDADWDLLMNVNARTPFFLTQGLLPALRRSDGACIVNIASVVAKKGYERQALYSASKHALLGFTKSVAREVAPEGIRVHAILPGGVNTDLLTGVRPDIDASQMIAPEEIAELVSNLVHMRGNAVIDEIEVRRRAKTPWA